MKKILVFVLMLAMCACGEKADGQAVKKVSVKTAKQNERFIVVDKPALNLSVYEVQKKDTVLLARYPVCVGKNYGQKEKSGDMKTPECTFKNPFEITEIKPASSWTHDFGDGRGDILAYGNWFMRLKTPGHKGIGIHGSTNNENTVPGRASEGCIRLLNNDLDELKAKYAFVGMKVVVLGDKVASSDKNVISSDKKDVSASKKKALTPSKITNVAFPGTVDLFGLYEVSFDLGSYSNPYDPKVIDVYAEFTGPDRKTRKVIGFYYEDYTFKNVDGIEEATATNKKGWRVRFTPDVVGSWSFVLHAVDASGHHTLSETERGRFTFQCSPVNSARGFITRANNQYLKRAVVSNGKKKYQSYYPVGPNVGWYSCALPGKYKTPYGIYDYEYYSDALSGNANYMRVWINRYQYLSLYGPEQTEMKDQRPVMYFDSSVNQKDAAELDYIIQYAAKHDLDIMLCLFSFRDFMHEDGTPTGQKKNPFMLSDWYNNPYHLILGLDSCYQFFTDPEAKRITKNLIRYIIARWGYATNIMCWELWNEVANMAAGEETPEATQHNIAAWHTEMANYIRSLDPNQHLLTTSVGSVHGTDVLTDKVFRNLDIVQTHTYKNIHKSKSKEQVSHGLFILSEQYLQQFPDKPFFFGEFAFSQSKPNTSYLDYDPLGVDLHNSLWSSLFSGTLGPASFWYWEIIKEANWFHHFKPMLTFSRNMPLLSGSFTPKTTGTTAGSKLVFPNNLETYYMINATEDTLFGWSQDTAFCYQSLRRLTDQVGAKGHFVEKSTFDPDGYLYTLNAKKKPRASSKSNTIVIPVNRQPERTRYAIKWFDAETGLELTTEATVATVGKDRTLRFEFPSSIRDVKRGTISNTYGDAVFMIYKISD